MHEEVAHPAGCPLLEAAEDPGLWGEAGRPGGTPYEGGSWTQEGSRLTVGSHGRERSVMEPDQKVTSEPVLSAPRCALLPDTSLSTRACRHTHKHTLGGTHSHTHAPVHTHTNTRQQEPWPFLERTALLRRVRNQCQSQEWELVVWSP